MCGTPWRRFVHTRSIRVKAFAGEIDRPRGNAHEPEAADHQVADERPFQLERCRALLVDASAVAAYDPRRYTGRRKEAVTGGQGK
jgi:hypothetical protein